MRLLLIFRDLKGPAASNDTTTTAATTSGQIFNFVFLLRFGVIEKTMTGRETETQIER